jgi:hypothetical protein
MFSVICVLNWLNVVQKCGHMWPQVSQVESATAFLVSALLVLQLALACSLDKRPNGGWG